MTKETNHTSTCFSNGIHLAFWHTVFRQFKCYVIDFIMIKCDHRWDLQKQSLIFIYLPQEVMTVSESNHYWVSPVSFYLWHLPYKT